MAQIVALQKIKSPESKEKFVSIYQAVHKVDNESAKNFFEVEAFNFKKRIEENDYLKDCTELSIAGVFLEVISNGLSFDKSANHVYLIPRSVKVGDKWEKRLTYTEAADGLVYLTKSAGSIESASVSLVYDGDDISVITENNHKIINHKPAIPRASNKIIGGFAIITLNKNGDTDAFWMDVSEVARLMAYSKKSNKSRKNPEGKANALYTSGIDGQIDEGFFKTKVLKAALKDYPKKKTLRDAYFDDENPSPSENLLLAEVADTEAEPTQAQVEETTSVEQNDMAF